MAERLFFCYVCSKTALATRSTKQLLLSSHTLPRLQMDDVSKVQRTTMYFAYHKVGKTQWQTNYILVYRSQTTGGCTALRVPQPSVAATAVAS